MALANKSLKILATRIKQKRHLFLGLMLFVIGSLLFSFFFGEMGLIHFQKMRAAKWQARMEVKALKKENDRLLYEIQALKSDPLYIELLARDRLGLSRPGDFTYEFYSQ